MPTRKIKPLTPRQQEVLDAVNFYGSHRNAAKALGLSKSGVTSLIHECKEKGFFPGQLSPVPYADGMRMTNTTVQYDAMGNVVQEWRRLSPDIEMMKDVVDELAEGVKGLGHKLPKLFGSKLQEEDLLFELDIYDPHIGMYAQKDETRDANYTCDLAVERMTNACTDLVGRLSKPRGNGVIVFGGDIMHSDTRSNRTEKSGNVLDVDNRYHRVVGYVVSVIRDAVSILATKCERIKLVFIEGNHDWHSCVWMAEVARAYFHGNNRIEVVYQPSPRKMLRFGENMLVWAHGDKIPSHKWAQIVAAEFAVDWGKTKFRHVKLGHIHHKKAIAPVVVQEEAGVLVEYVEALCPSDAWHVNSGYVGTQKGASAFEYHRTKGLYTRHLHTV